MSVRILYFSRGRGFGHAKVDEIVSTALKKYYDVEVVLASYGDGYHVLKEVAPSTMLMNIDIDNEGDKRNVEEIDRIFTAVNPGLIITHEVFQATLISYKYKCPSIVITHWFDEQILGIKNSINTQLMQLSNEIVFIDIEQFHVPPPCIEKKTSFVGPVIPGNKLEYFGKYDGQKNRILINLGGRYTHNKLLFDHLLKAFSIMDAFSDYKIVLLAGCLANELREKVIELSLSNVEVCRYVNAPYMHSDKIDFALGRGSFTTMAEMVTIGIPSLHILMDDNPVDTFHANNLAKAGCLRQVEFTNLSIEDLCNEISITRQWAHMKRNEIIEAGYIYRNRDPIKNITRIISKYL